MMTMMINDAVPRSMSINLYSEYNYYKSSGIFKYNRMNQSHSSSFGEAPQNFSGDVLGDFPYLEPEQSEEEEFNFEDAFQDARREEVLRTINQASFDNNQQEKHQQVMNILDKRTKREQRIQQKKVKDQMKKLRQQNAMQFFRKVKLHMLLNFRDSISTMRAALSYRQNKLHRFISCLSLELVQNLQKLRDKRALAISRKQFIDLIMKIFADSDLKTQQKYEIIASLALFLGVGFRKLSFIDISDMELQSFYNLKYIPTKGKKKKLTQEIDLLRNRLQRKVAEEQLKDHNFVNLDDYSFDPAKIYSQNSKSLNEIQSKSNLNSIASRNEMIRSIKKTFHNSYCQIYCPVESNWSIFNMEVFITQQISEIKNQILEGRAIIGFYSIRMIKFQDKYQSLSKDRLLKNFEVRDHTADFCDNNQNILKRRYRLGCKALYKNLIKDTNFYRTLRIFSQFDKTLIQFERKKEQEWAHQNFPKTVKQMKMSNYFVTPSLVEKYLIIKQGAKPIPNIEFHEEKVYYKSDLQRVSSRMGWVDENRMVKQGQIPIKTTQNKNKTTTKLFKFNQTEPFYIKIENGEFVLDQEYNSIYVPPVFQIPKGYVIIEANVEYLCKRNKYRCARIVQGFSMAGGHLVPNNIGYMVEESHREEIQKIYKQRQQKLKLKKQSKKIQNAMSLWRKLFKSIIITQQVNQN